MATSTTSSRWAVAFLFFACGFLYGGWVAHIPSTQSEFQLSEGRLGSLLFVIATGAVGMMSLCGALIQRLGSRHVAVVAALANAGALCGVFLAPSEGWLVVALFLFGAAGGAMDVAMNDQAVLVQRRYGRSIMSSFHALFSVGGLAGALIGALALRLGEAALLQGGLSAVLVGAGTTWAAPHLIEATITQNRRLFGLALDRRLLGPALLMLVCFMSEGVVADWAALYLRDHACTSAATAPLGFAAFSVTMTAGRLFGDALIDHLGQKTTAAAGGMVASGGMALALAVPTPAVGILGFALVGMGLSNLVPMIFTKAGNVPGLPSSDGLATVSVAGYGAFLAGPPFIGYLAEYTSLPAALRLLVAFGLIIAMAASGFVPERSRKAVQRKE
jgi:MFS family permease